MATVGWLLASKEVTLSTSAGTETAERRESNETRIFVSDVTVDAWLSASNEEPPIEIRVTVAQTQWEVNERTAHVLKITNPSAQLVTVPSFHFLNVKGEQPEIDFYLEEHILKMEVVPIRNPFRPTKSRRRPEKPQPFPTVDLQPKETVSVGFR